MLQTRCCRSRAVLRVVLAPLLFFCLVVLVSACDGNYLVWSSDGKLGAVVGARGLRVCDGEGTISPVLVAKAGMFRWMPQSHQGLVVGYEYVNTWSQLKPLLNSEQEKQIAEEALKLKQKVYGYHGDPKKFAESALRTFNYPLEAALNLHSTALPELEKMTLRKWSAYNSVKVPVFFIKLAQLEAQQVKLLRVIDRGIDEIVELRLSPNGKNLACVKHEHEQERNYIVLLSLDGPGKSVPVAYDTNSYPDWSADSRVIYYSRANSNNEPDLLKGHGVHEGGLFKVEVADLSSAKALPLLKPQRLANLVFDNRAPVRCLKDGRLLFASREIRLPSSVNATPAAALFCLESNRVDTVIRRSEDVVYFEPSPDEDMLAVTLGGGGGLLVCKINGAEPIELCNGKDLRLSGLLPQWKTSQELSYGTELPGPRGSKPNYSIVLWSRGAGSSKELSKSWGKDANAEISIHRDFFQEAMTGVMEDMDRHAGK